MSTTTKAETIALALDQGNVNKIGDALALVKLGTMVTPLKLTFTGLTAAAAHDLTNVAHGSNLPALVISTLRATTVGTAAAGARFITDAGGTASATVALLSDDGKTITFEGTVTGFIVEYMPRATNDVTGFLNKAS